MFKEKVKMFVEEALAGRPELFITELSVQAGHRVVVVIDGDRSVTLEDCTFVSRAVERALDREGCDFSLDVMSHGVTTPLVNMRQYKKNINRTLAVKTATTTIEGVLVEVSETSITLAWKTRQPKPLGKGKVTVQKQARLAYSDIVTGRVVIKF